MNRDERALLLLNLGRVLSDIEDSYECSDYLGIIDKINDIIAYVEKLDMGQ